MPLIVDFSDPDEVLRKAGQDAIALLGKVDVLVNRDDVEHLPMALVPLKPPRKPRTSPDVEYGT